MASVLDLVKHYQHSIEKYANDEQKVLKCIDKLFNLDVTVQHLQETGVGRTVNALRKEPGDIGQAARALVYKWKLMVAAEESDQEDHNESAGNNEYDNGHESDHNVHKAEKKSNKHDNILYRSRGENTSHQSHNGSYGDSNKRKYESSEEEEPNNKKAKHIKENGYKVKTEMQIKKEPSDSDNNSHDDDSSDSESERSDSQSSKEEQRNSIKNEKDIKQEQSSKAQHSRHNDKEKHKYDKHSKHSYEKSPRVKSRSSHKYSRSPSNDYKSQKKEYRTSAKENRSSEKEYNLSEKEHRLSEKEHRATAKEHRSSEKEHRSSEIEHRYSEKEHRSSEKEHPSERDNRLSEKGHKSSEKNHRSSEKEHRSSMKEHRSSDKEHRSSDKEHRSSEKEHRSSGKDNKPTEKEHKSSGREKLAEKVRESSSKQSGSSDKHKTSSVSDKNKSSSYLDKHKSHDSDKQRNAEKNSNKMEKHSSSKSDKSKNSSDKETSSNKHNYSESKTSGKDKLRPPTSEAPKDQSTSSKEKDVRSDKKHSLPTKSDVKIHNSISRTDKNDEKSVKKCKSSSSKTSNKSKEKIPKRKSEINGRDSDDGIDCGSGASFAEALGMGLPSKQKKKSNTSKENTTPPKGVLHNDLSPAALLSPSAKLAPLPAIEISALPEISPNYRPRPPPKFLPHFSDEDAMSAVISTKNQRTKVYSGNKIYGKIPSLYEMCVQVLQEHIDALEYTGGVPYDILKPVIDRATPQQLFMLEHYNPYLMEDTDHLWQRFCEKSFRTKKRQEMETWREMYIRCQEEQEIRLRSLTANIKIAQEAKKAPIKQTKMAYVDSVVKPPRNIAKKQAQHGTAFAATASPAARVASLAVAPNVLKTGRPTPVATVSSSSFKPKKAPLMQKALQFMRGRKR